MVMSIMVIGWKGRRMGRVFIDIKILGIFIMGPGSMERNRARGLINMQMVIFMKADFMKDRNMEKEHLGGRVESFMKEIG